MKTAIKLGQEIANGTLDPVELAEQTFETIEGNANQADIFARLTKDRAMAEAKAARKRQQEDALQSPIDGVPISWKDLFDTAGIATESGSRLLKGRVPENDALVVERMTAAGTVCVGKTHLSELAFSGLGINPKAATSPNRHGVHLAPGGSSSGAAASVAHGMVPIGIGSDTGGSVRIPSAWNDLVGQKTSHGFLPSDGIIPLCSGFDTAGPLCTSLADAWVATAIMAGETPTLPQAKPLDQCTFLISESHVLDDLGDNQRKGFEQAIEALARAGATIDRLTMPEFEEILPLGPILFPYEAWQEWGDAIEAQPDLMFEPVRNRFMSGKGLTKDEYDQASNTMHEIRKRFNAKLAQYDALLAPTVAIAPPEIEPLLNDFELFSATNMLALKNTRFFNLFGSCALSLPTSQSASGLMVVGEPMNDKKLTSIGLSIEKVLT
ncbi:MAG: amidase family protein [Pseudomonadota bacterium]